MIIRAELPELEMFIAPRPFYVALVPPRSFALQHDSVIPKQELHTLIFVPETDPEIYEPDVFVKWDEVHYRWRCESCNRTGYNDIFSTGWAQIRVLEKGAPTYMQQREMSAHGRQHEIIWAWVRMEKK